MNELRHPLAPAELDELDDFLATDDATEAAMDLSTLEGYLTAIVIGPQTVMPSRWLPWVWDSESGEAEASFADLDQAYAIARHLIEKNCALTLFSTHYFELTRLAQDYPECANVHLDAVERGKTIVFMHAVEEVAASQSYGATSACAV